MFTADTSPPTILAVVLGFLLVFFVRLPLVVADVLLAELVRWASKRLDSVLTDDGAAAA